MKKKKIKTRYYEELPKAVIAFEFSYRGYDVTVINKCHILKYYAKKVFHYFFESKEEFYAHLPYITAIFAGIMLNVVAKIVL